jgi:Raf kinase inhibitor-like YbhB/YbcL family protein
MGDDGHIIGGDNMPPEISWAGAPSGTKSYVVVVYDKDVPKDLGKANKDTYTYPAYAPRRRFYHLLVANVPASQNILNLQTGAPPGAVFGANSYQGIVDGEHVGWDGPCPPWNDTVVHRYIFEVYAIDTDALPVRRGFRFSELKSLVELHALARGSELVKFQLKRQ